MALHAEATLATRLVTYDKNTCQQCQAWLLAPDWSEYLNERCVRHTWSCEACGYAFETTVFFSAARSRRRIGVKPAAIILDHSSVRAQVIRPDRRLAVAARDIEHIGRLAKSGSAAVQRAHQRLTFGDGGAQMRRAGRQIGVVQVIGFDPAFDQRAQQGAERLRHRR